eukprot:CAMPEP_0113322178 /NCGR_PEP_ID=MMETSP0010_2-20120614/15437_1 /TAXON_ID=216773 ORGANISM="Corethron hystrix, Strain 308" /NCGR_SAMPLE_ID=MMETSP0010_2 /ASSEMBLY_ACC=CAM_ASM_000155 /LENGTH=69 /DNA_ID=CAMNT_0000180601 /DNA_START=12 /DNA_END=217 /DNA_ORIENTATION=- /assembly_acc=CAM_ASM_000155
MTASPRPSFLSRPSAEVSLRPGPRRFSLLGFLALWTRLSSIQASDAASASSRPRPSFGNRLPDGSVVLS